jgi:hypothetical protein
VTDHIDLLAAADLVLEDDLVDEVDHLCGYVGEERIECLFWKGGISGAL